MRILLADDHHLVREAIASYLTRAAPDITCIEAADFRQVRERLEESGAFDLVILDYRMPGMNGLSGLDEVKASLPQTPVAVLSGAMDAGEAERALERDASGVIMKNLRGTALLTMERIAYDQVARPVEFARHLYRASRYAFTTSFPRPEAVIG